ncbi:MAG: SidA/IucD/PvdA family monooxygenase, partial [Dietzia sp.]
VVHTAAGDTFRGRRLVLGTGTTPYVPEALRSVVGSPGLDTVAAQPARPPSTTAIHSADYLQHKAALQATESITVVGSGQSAAEVYADLLADVDRCGYTLNWLTRSPRFFPMEYTKLTLEMTSPEYTAYFQGLPAATRERLLASQRGLYKGISSATIDTIFEMLRTRQVSLEPHQRRGETTLLTATEVTGARREGDEITLDLHHTEVDDDFALRTSSLVLATGYRPQVPAFLTPVRDRIRWDERGRY